MAAERFFIGEVNGKDYYWDPEEDSIVWRVPDVREVIRAKPGYKILSADYSQVEVKIMGFLSQDPDLIAAINSGKDIHSYIATDIFGQKLGFTYEDITAAKEDKNHPRHKELSGLRSKTKTTTFGVPLTYDIVAL